mmetsp:Transcript_102665/g.181940  ORF Transcript_102665/g.181940 Transcript_102665/m.181940 type:complete len:111 (+) Transcript_102665:97-429(+)
MPLVTVLTDVPAVAEKAEEVCLLVHNAVKEGLGKPDQFITVSVSKSECITVGGTKASVVVEVDSIGGDLNSIIGKISEGLKTYEVDPSKVVGTFRAVSRPEFAMNGRALG